MRVSHTFAGDFGIPSLPEIVAGRAIFYQFAASNYTGNGVKNVNAYILASAFAGVTVHCGDSPVFDKINNLSLIDRHHALNAVAS